MFAERSMGEAHAGLEIEDAHFDRVVEHLASTLAELGVPAETIRTTGNALSPLRSEIVAN